MAIFNEERSNYYKAKKRELTRLKTEERVAEEDALFVHYYGMSAYIELFPEVKGFGMSWHTQVLKELQKLERRNLAQQLTGNALAYASTKSKKSARHFKRMVKDLTRKT